MNDLHAYIDAVAGRVLNSTDPKGGDINIHKFDWVEGVGLYGVNRVWETFREPVYSDFLEGWIQQHRAEAFLLKTVNSTAPFMTILDFAGEWELDLCRNCANFILYEAPRTQCGGLEHTVTEAGVSFQEQMWADTLFMVCIFLAKLGKRTGEKKYTDEAIRQLRLHYQYLKDPETGLFFHGYHCSKQNHLSGARWGRANAWVTAATVEMLELLPENFVGRDEILATLGSQAAAYGGVQREDGLFYTVLDRPDGYPETSATAGIAYGIFRGVKDKYLPESLLPIARRAAKAVTRRIDDKGNVLGVSGGTPIMPTIEAYHGIEVRPRLYGQALALLMLCEMYQEGIEI